MRSLFVFVALASCQVTLGNPVQCGVPQYPVRKAPPNGNRVVGGWEAQAHSLPWTVRLVTFLDDNLTMAAHCGGSLIQMKPGNGTDMVLSASHCFFDTENFAWFPVSRVYALVGIHNHRNKNEQSRRVLKAKSLICDRKFAEVKHAEDIALIQLAEMVPYTDKTRPICLPEKDEELTPGKECFVSGWGVTSETGPGSDVLLMVHVKALENSKCFRQVYRDIVFCAGHLEGGKDACEGDSGGPLFCEVDGKYVQYGIVSQGDGCARRNLPGEYTKLSKFIGWLEDNVKTMQGYDKGVKPITRNNDILLSNVGTQSPSSKPQSSFARPESPSTRPVATPTKPQTPITRPGSSLTKPLPTPSRQKHVSPYMKLLL